MGFWKNFFGGETNAEEEKKNADEKNFDLLKYDGVKALRIGQFDYAVKCFEKALQIKEDPEIHDYLSRAYLQQGRTTDALTELKTVIRLEPDNANLFLQAASIAYISEDYTEMTAMCQKADALLPDNAIVQLLFAKAELGQANLVQGIARLTKAIALDENFGEARLLRAQTLLKMGELNGASEDVDWLEEKAEPNEDVLLTHARLEYAKSNYNEAIALYSKVIDVNPFNIDAFKERGKIRLNNGDKKGAEEDMKMVLELSPQDMADVNGEYSAEGIEQKTRQAYSNLNPFGI